LPYNALAIGISFVWPKVPSQRGAMVSKEANAACTTRITPHKAKNRRLPSSCHRRRPREELQPPLDPLDRRAGKAFFKPLAIHEIKTPYEQRNRLLHAWRGVAWASEAA